MPRTSPPFVRATTAEDVARHVAKAHPDEAKRARVVLVTGASAGGLGFETALVIARDVEGATVYVTARSDERLAASLAALRERLPDARKDHVQGVVADLTDPESVRRGASALRVALAGHTLDSVICNAGVMAFPTRRATKFGSEEQMSVNFLAHFLLVRELLPVLTPSTGRVVLLSSVIHRDHDKSLAWTTSPTLESKRYSPLTAYGNSKLAVILFARELVERHGVCAIAVHPGVTQTNLQHSFGFPLSLVWALIGRIASDRSVPQAAAGSVFAAIHPDAAKVAGKYLVNTRPAKVVNGARTVDDAEVRKRVWDAAEKLCGL